MVSNLTFAQHGCCKCAVTTCCCSFKTIPLVHRLHTDIIVQEYTSILCIAHGVSLPVVPGAGPCMHLKTSWPFPSCPQGTQRCH